MSVEAMTFPTEIQERRQSCFRWVTQQKNLPSLPSTSLPVCQLPKRVRHCRCPDPAQWEARKRSARSFSWSVTSTTRSRSDINQWSYIHITFTLIRPNNPRQLCSNYKESPPLSSPQSVSTVTSPSCWESSSSDPPAGNSSSNCSLNVLSRWIPGRWICFNYVSMLQMDSVALNLLGIQDTVDT